jgi:hypothetical protein
MKHISLKQIRLGSVFKLGYLAFFVIIGPLWLLFGINALFGGQGMYLNGQPSHGIGAFIAALIMALVMPLLPATLLLAGSAILRLLGNRGPKLRLENPEDIETGGSLD